jgi:hypothetical protein
MKVTKGQLRRIIREALHENFEPGEKATAAGLKQDIEARSKRGEFEKGDWGIHGPTGYSDRGGLAGEYSGYGDYPWIRDALQDLENETDADKAAAVSNLAHELGISIQDLGDM